MADGNGIDLGSIAAMLRDLLVGQEEIKHSVRAVDQRMTALNNA